MDKSFISKADYGSSTDPARAGFDGWKADGEDVLAFAPFPALNFVSLDLPSEAELAEKNPELFLQRHPPPVIIDEVQYAPSLFRFLKVYIDRHRDESGLFFLTGPQKFVMMQSVGDSLAGRIEVLELEPLSLKEIRASGFSGALEDVVFRGAFFKKGPLHEFVSSKTMDSRKLTIDSRNILLLRSCLSNSFPPGER